MIRVKYYVGEVPYQISNVTDMKAYTLPGGSYIALISDTPLEVHDRDGQLCSWQTVADLPGRIELIYNGHPYGRPVEFDRTYTTPGPSSIALEEWIVHRFKIKG